MKRYIAVFITVLILIVPFSLSASALSQQINGFANNSTATFYVTISDEDMKSCNGSFSVSGGNISFIALAGNGTLSVNGNSYKYSGGSSATIVVSCNMVNDSVVLTSNDVQVFDGNGNMVGVVGKTNSRATFTTTTTTTEESTTEESTTEESTTKESTTEESTTEETSTTTTTTEIVIAPTRPMPQNNVGGGLNSKLIVVLIVVVANVILAFAVGILLGKRRGESIKYNLDENVEDILGDVEDRFDQSADD